MANVIHVNKSGNMADTLEVAHFLNSCEYSSHPHGDRKVHFKEQCAKNFKYSHKEKLLTNERVEKA